MPTVLLVEDNVADIVLMEEVIADHGINVDLQVVTDGAAAIDFLRQIGEHQAAPRPDLVILDLNLPKKHGLEVLAEVTKDDDLKTIPVLVMSTSNSPQDVARSYELHANCFVRKPNDLAMFNKVIDAIEHYWLEIATLPPRCSACWSAHGFRSTPVARSYW